MSSFKLVGDCVYPGRVEGNLVKASTKASYSNNDILVVDLPSLSLALHFGRVKGIILLGGGLTSHLALVAREYRKPCFITSSNPLTEFSEGELVRFDSSDSSVRGVANGSE